MLLARVSPGQRRLSLVIVQLLLISPLLLLSASALVASDFAAPTFQRTWERTDKPVTDGLVTRTWVWGSQVTGALDEPYDEAPDESRVVQYFDKSRMEDNSYRAADAPWDVTNGLLVVELMSGMQQDGDASFGIVGPASVNVAGDAADPDAVTYADLGALRDAPPAAAGATITQRVDDEGVVGDDPSLASHGVTADHRLTVPGIDHQIASVFWDYMNSTGPVWEDGAAVTGNLFPDAYYATGFPITEAYWTNVDVGGNDTLVLLQCFERRCLTYTPTNAPEWRVEMGNVGLHYHTWRYAPLPSLDGLVIGFLSTQPLAPEIAPTIGHPAPELAQPRQIDSTIPIGRVSIEDYIRVTAPGESPHVFRLSISTENAGQITGYELSFNVPGQPSRVLHSATFSPLQGEQVEDVLSPEDLDVGFPLDDEGAGRLFASGAVSIVVFTTEYPDGMLQGTLELSDEFVISTDLRAEFVTPNPPPLNAVGNATFLFNATDNTIRYTLTQFGALNTTGAYIALGGDPNQIVVDNLAAPAWGVPAVGTIGEQDLIGPYASLFLENLAQDLFNGDAQVVVPSVEYPGGALQGTTNVLDPRYKPWVGFAVMDGDNAGTDSDDTGSAILTWNTLDEFNLLVVADIVDVTGVEMRYGVLGQNGERFFDLEATPRIGRASGIVGEWTFGTYADRGGLSPHEFAYNLDAWHFSVVLNTDEYPDGAISGHVQRPNRLEPLGVYVAELNGQTIPPFSDTAATMTVVAFHSGNQPAYGGEAITTQVFCNNADGLTGLSLYGYDQGGEHALAGTLAEWDAQNPANPNGLCYSGGITRTDSGTGAPWFTVDRYWPDDGWGEREMFASAEFVNGDRIAGFVAPVFCGVCRPDGE